MVVGGHLVTPESSLPLLAMCSAIDKEFDVKEIVMERIEILEAVNRAPTNCKSVIDTRSISVDSSSKSHSYSESDVFLSLGDRSMVCLALALKQFVLNETDNLKTQWTWKQCLNFAIERMNNVGVKCYSSFATLSRWHRKFARNHFFFYKAPEPKTLYPAFFVQNLDAMEAFKKHGVANIKDLRRVEMMLEYVHQELIPKLMLKREAAAGLFDDNGDDAANVVVVTADALVPQMPTTKASFLQLYGMSKISVATMVRWMHACGFRYKKREKHYFVDGHE